MATAYSDEVAVGSYNRIRLRVEYSGTSATCYMEFRRTSSYTGAWADSQASITFNGTTKSAPYSYSGTVGTSWVQLCNASGFTVSTSGGTYSWSFNNPGGSSVLGCSGTIVIGSQASAPSDPTISNVSTTSSTLTGTLSLSSWGYPDSGRFEYYFGTTSATTDDYTLSPASGYSSAKTTTINKTSLTSNQTYYVRYRVWNQQLNNPSGLILGGPYITLAPAPTVSISSTTSSSVTIAYSTSADGGYYSKSIQYSIDGGTAWVTGATVSSGSAASGTYTISGLTFGTTYSVQTRVSTTAGTTAGETLSVTLGATPKLYGGSSQGALKIGKLYGKNPSKNLFDNSATPGRLGGNMAVTTISTGVRTSNTTITTGSFDAAVYKIGLASEYAGKTITMSCTATPSSTNVPQIIIGLGNADLSTRISKSNATGSGNKTIQWTVAEDSSAPYLIVWLYNNASGSSISGSVGSITVDYTNLMLEVGSSATAYTPYLGPQGTIKIKKLYGSVNGVAKLIFRR